MIYLSGKIDRKTIEINALVITVMLYLLRATVPFFKYPFLLLFFGLIIYSSIYKQVYAIPGLKIFYKSFYVIFFLVLALLASFLLSDKIYLIIFKDLCNTLILGTLFLLMAINIHSNSDLKIFYNRFTFYVIIFGFMISCILLLNLFFLSPYHNNSALHHDSWISYIEMISKDYNFALLPVFSGIIAAFFLINDSCSVLKKVSLNILLIIYSITILFSGSRRGLILLSCFIILLVLNQLVLLVRKDILLRQIRHITKWYLLSISIMTFLLIGFLFIIPIKTKINTLNILGISVKSFKNISYNILSRYPAIISNPGYDRFQKIFWNEKPNPLFPDTWWGFRIYTTEFPLSGENVRIVPENAVGYKMDNTCNADSWNNNAYSYTDISGLFNSDLTQDSCKNYFASVYCFVSKDFDGTYVRLAAEGEIKGKVFQEYNLNEKGSWQKLNIKFRPDSKTRSGIPPVYLYWAKFGVFDFSSLKGYVIYAYPQYYIDNTNDSISVSAVIHSRNNLVPIDDKNEKFNLDNLISIENAEYHSTKQLLLKNRSAIKAKLDLNAAFLNNYLLTESGLITNMYLTGFLSLIDKIDDPVRRWTAKLISEDTVYHAYKSIIVVDAFQNNVIAERIVRWRFAFQIFLKEYNIKQKLFGGGFNFLNWYGYYFLKDRTLSDYPHNPFLSILLYSGLLGLILYVFLLFKAVKYYSSYFQEYSQFFLFFLITFFLSFFSAGSPFDPPVMGFFFMLPFFVNSIKKNISNNVK